jgi:hypothetical protein
LQSSHVVDLQVIRNSEHPYAKDAKEARRTPKKPRIMN